MLKSTKQFQKAPNSVRLHFSSADRIQLTSSTTTTTSGKIQVNGNGNDAFNLITEGRTETVFLEPGQYTQTEFIAMVNQAFQDTLLYDFTCSIFQSKFRLQVPIETPAVKISFVGLSNSAASILGFTANSEVTAINSSSFGVIYAQNNFPTPTATTTIVSTTTQTDSYKIDLTEYQQLFDKDRPVYVTLECLIAEGLPTYIYNLQWENAPIARQAGSSQTMSRVVSHFTGNGFHFGNIPADALGMQVNFDRLLHTKEWTFKFYKHDGTLVSEADLGAWVFTMVIYQKPE